MHPSVYGGIDSKRYIIETNGAGVALVDVDRDGWLDALVLSGTRLDPDARTDATFESGAAPLQPAISQQARRHLRGHHRPRRHSPYCVVVERAPRRLR